MDEIIVKYGADIADLQKGMKEIEKSMKAAEAVGKDAAKNTTKEFSKAGDEIKSIGKEILAALGLAFGVAKVIEFGKESIKAFQDAETAALKLKFAVEKIGGEGGDAFKKLVDQAEKLSKTTIFSKTTIEAAQTQLLQLGLNSKQTEILTKRVTELASGLNEDLPTAITRAVGGINGMQRANKDIGANFKDTGDKVTNLNKFLDLTEKFTGSAAVAMDTAAGRAKVLANQTEELQISLGEKLNPAWEGFKNILFESLNTLLDFDKAAKYLKETLDKQQTTIDAYADSFKKYSDAQLTAIKNNNIEQVKALEAQKRAVDDFALSQLESGKLSKDQENAARKVAKDKEAYIQIQIDQIKEQTLGIQREQDARIENAKAVKNEFDLKADLTKLSAKELEARRILIEESKTMTVSEQAQQTAAIDKELKDRVEANKNLQKEEEDRIKKSKAAHKAQAEEEIDEEARVENEKLAIKRDANKLYIESEAQKAKAAEASKNEEDKIQAEIAANTAAMRNDKLSELDIEIAKINDGFDKENEAHKQLLEDKKIDESDYIAWFNSATDKKNADIAKSEKKAQMELNQFLYKEAQSLFSSILQIQQNNLQRQIDATEETHNSELDSLQDQLDKKKITQDQYDKKKKESDKKAKDEAASLKRQQFLNDKRASEIQIIIDTAESVMATYKKYGFSPIGIALAILAGVAGAAQLAVVESQPTPKFEKGGKVKGQRHYAGGTVIEAEKDEWIIKRDEALKHDKLLNAINSGKGESYIYNQFVAPALRIQQKKYNEQKEKSFASNLANSMMFNFKDENLLDSLKQSRRNDKDNTIYLAKVIESSKQSSRKW